MLRFIVVLVFISGLFAATAQVGNPSTDGGNAEKTRKLLGLEIIYGEAADKEAGSAERGRLHNEFLDKSADFLKQNPDTMKLWLLRGAIAVERKDEKTGEEAGQNLLRLKADKIDDPKVQTVLALLERRDWLSATPKPKQSTNSLGMKFVPVKGTSVMFSVWETRVQDYAAYANSASGVDSSWKDPVLGGKPVTPGPTHPVVNVSWEDARKFCAWLTEKDRRAGLLTAQMEYRLPTDHEWSWAVGIGDRENAGSPKDKDEKLAGVYPWGTQWPPPSAAGNFSDQTAKRAFSNFTGLDGYDDGFAVTSPAGYFAANSLGLFDLSGNVWEWCEDLYDPAKAERVLRGGSWVSNGPRTLLSSFRGNYVPGGRDSGIGFRCVLAGAGGAR